MTLNVVRRLKSLKPKWVESSEYRFALEYLGFTTDDAANMAAFSIYLNERANAQEKECGTP